MTKEPEAFPAAISQLSHPLLTATHLISQFSDFQASPQRNREEF